MKLQSVSVEKKQNNKKNASIRLLVFLAKLAYQEKKKKKAVEKCTIEAKTFQEEISQMEGILKDD